MLQCFLYNRISPPSFLPLSPFEVHPSKFGLPIWSSSLLSDVEKSTIWHGMAVVEHTQNGCPHRKQAPTIAIIVYLELKYKQTFTQFLGTAISWKIDNFNLKTFLIVRVLGKRSSWQLMFSPLCYKSWPVHFRVNVCLHTSSRFIMIYMAPTLSNPV